MAEVIAQNVEGPYKGPAVGMQLGRGHINLCEQRALEPRQWQAELDPLEDGVVHEEERTSSWFVRSSTHTGSPFSQGRTDTYASCSLPKTTHFSSASPSLYVMTSWLEVYLEVSVKRSLGAQW